MAKRGSINKGFGVNEASRTTAARTPLKLGGRELLVSPLTDRGIAELDEWLRWRYLQNVRDSFRPEDSGEVREMETRIAQENALSITMLSGRGVKILGTVDGMARLVLQMCAPNHADLTLDECRKLIASPENVRAATEAFNRANAPPESSEASSEKQKGNAEAVNSQQV